MNASVSWNFIVEDYKKLFTAKEETVDNRWRQYCTDLFGYKTLFNEVKTQTSITVGVHDHAIPDIILCRDGNDIFDIELKQYSFSFEKKMEDQLISYLKLTGLSVGMIVCKEIHLYVYNYARKETKKIIIPFTIDNEYGIKLIELLNRDTFSKDGIVSFIEEVLEEENRIKSIKEQLSSDFVLKLIREHFLSTCSEKEVKKALEGLTVTVHSKQEKNPVVHSPIDVPIVDPILPDNTVEMSNLLMQWCIHKHNEGVIILDTNKCTKTYKRFTTSQLDRLIPPQTIGSKSGWNNNRFCYYEIVNRSGYFYIWLALSHKNAPQIVNDSFEKVLNWCHEVPKKENWEWKVLFKSRTIDYRGQNLEDIIPDQLDSLFEELMRNEAALIAGLSHNSN